MFSVVNSTIIRFFFLFNFFGKHLLQEELEFYCFGRIFNRNFGNEKLLYIVEKLKKNGRMGIISPILFSK